MVVVIHVFFVVCKYKIFKQNPYYCVNNMKMSVAMETATGIIAAQLQCQFFVVRKKRLCRMTVRPGRRYCGEHEPQPPAEHQQTDKRVPCPNDPKHTCYVSKLEMHLLKCNARQVEDPPYIVRNINAPEDEGSCQRVPLKCVLVVSLQQVIDQINTLYDSYVKSTISTYSPPAEHHAAVAGCIAQQDRTDSSRRHLRQASRLMQLAEDEGLVAEDTCYVELGAGKGMLSYYMGCAWCGQGADAGGSRVLCVDRASLRHKRDNRLAGRATRLRADLRHLALHDAPAVSRAGAVVGLAKHLCGVATDYALRCLTGAGVRQKVRGALLATCCHHRCEAQAYVGGQALQKLGITGEQLNIMFGIVSWATCGDGRSRDQRLAGSETNPPLEGDGISNGDRNTGEKDTSKRDTNSISLLFSREKERYILTQETADMNQPISSRAIRHEDIMNGTESDTNTNEHDVSTGNKAVPTALLPLPAIVREEIGRRAKALIDYGRVLYLREKGFKVRLCYYVPTTESLENVCIVCTKDGLTHH